MVWRPRLGTPRLLAVLALVGALVLSGSTAAAYTWQPTNTSVSARSTEFSLRFSSLEIICQAQFAGRTGGSREARLRLTLTASSCRGTWPFERVTITNNSPAVTLTATAHSEGTPHGEGYVSFSGSYTIEIAGLCTVGVSGDRRFLFPEEFILSESIIGSILELNKAFNTIVVSRGPYMEACAGQWYLYAQTGQSFLSPSNLGISP